MNEVETVRVQREKTWVKVGSAPERGWARGSRKAVIFGLGQ
jgi:hypothetical protein